MRLKWKKCKYLQKELQKRPEMLGDNITQYIRTALNFLLLKYPTRTTMGLLFGVVGDFLIDVFHPFLSKLKWLNLAAFNAWRIGLFGAFIANLPAVFSKGNLREDLEEKFEVIRRSVREGELTKVEGRLLYQRLALDVISKARLKGDLEKRIKDLSAR